MSGKNAVFERLRRHPSYGQKPLPTFTIVIGLVNVSGHAEICNDPNQRRFILGSVIDSKTSSPKTWIITGIVQL